MWKLLEAKNLSVKFRKSNFVLRPLAFEINNGETVAIIGESGSGKTTLLKALSCLSDDDAIVSGEVKFKGIELVGMKELVLRKYRFSSFSMVFQNSNEYLNPRLTLKESLFEILIKKFDRAEIMKKALELMREVGLDESVLDNYPHELSGGMIQKFQIACAVSLTPELIYLDEPTSSLDAASRNEFVSLIKKIKKDYGTAFICVTHDMALAAELADRTIVMYQGIICEEAETAALIRMPRHPYSRALLNCAVELNLYKDAWGIRDDNSGGQESGCPFAGRCTQSIPDCFCCIPELTESAGGGKLSCIRGGIVNVLECEEIKKSYGGKTVLTGCNLELYSGEIVSIVGRSGSGKTTLCNILAGFLAQDSGSVTFCGRKADYDSIYRRMNGLQFLMQDHGDSLDPHLSVYNAINEPLYLFADKSDHHMEVKDVLEAVGLEHTDTFLQRKIHTLSGGQRQRIGLARCLITQPSVLIADEPTSMLDSSSKANLNRLLKASQNISGFSMLVVTHDLPSALKISDRIYLLRDGVLKELESALPPEKIAELMYNVAAH